MSESSRIKIGSQACSDQKERENWEVNGRVLGRRVRHRKHKSLGDIEA
jgi:hypothetical protein